MKMNTMTLLALSALILSCTQDLGVPDEDKTFLTTPEGEGILAPEWPVHMSFDASLPEEIGAFVMEARDLVNEGLGAEALSVDGSGRVDVVISTVNLVPQDEGFSIGSPGEFEDTEIVYDPETSEVRRCYIEISTRVLEWEDHDYVVLSLRQALLHCVCALDDDPGLPGTVELQSIMSRPLDPSGSLTEQDRELCLGSQP